MRRRLLLPYLERLLKRLEGFLILLHGKVGVASVEMHSGED
jgi:hypothetical protein